MRELVTAIMALVFLVVWIYIILGLAYAAELLLDLIFWFIYA
jgi:hypothetical protein